MKPLDRTLLAIFSAEQAEHLASVRTLLPNVGSEDSSRSDAAIDDLLRRLHTLKGAARAVGLEETEMLTHQAEAILLAVRAGGIRSFATVRQVLDRAVDRIEDVLAAAVAERTIPADPELITQLAELSSAPVESEPAVAQDPAPAPAPEKSPTDIAPDLMRIHSRYLDDLIRDSSELLIETNADARPQRFAAYAARIEDTAKEWSTLRRASASAVHAASQSPEFRPLLKCLSFVDGWFNVLHRETRAVNEDLSLANRSARARAEMVYQEACRIRMTPAEAVFGAFGPMVRDLAHQTGREVGFHAEGLETNADLVVLQALKDAVMHLLRNAVSHGIELPEERIRAGKPPRGNIALRVSCRGDRLQLLVEDDGHGIDYREIEKAARDQGLLQAGESAENIDIGSLIFQAGFSTSKAVTGVSGRGLGLAIVDRALRRLHGEIALHPRPGGGTRVVISAPLSISTQHMLLVAVAGQIFAIATAYVDMVIRVEPSEIRQINGRDSVMTEWGPVRLVPLHSILGLAGKTDSAETMVLSVVVNMNRRRFAFRVDDLLDEREAIVKDSGLRDQAAGFTAGAIPMEDGSVAVVLNVNALMEGAGRIRRAPTLVRVASPEPPRKKRILVVDDSLTTRSLEKSILEANGYEVSLAVDGVEALDRLRLQPPDLVISDVAMPRMTGFQLLEQMKKDEKMKKIPCILVTSLESREEQQLGMSLGAEAYIVKRKFDQRELLTLIRDIL